MAPCWLFPKQFTVGVLNAVLSVAALAAMLCPPPWSCFSLVSQLVSHLAWLLCPPPWSCLPACLPSGLGCCVRLPGLVFLFSPVLSPACLLHCICSCFQHVSFLFSTCVCLFHLVLLGCLSINFCPMKNEAQNQASV